MSRQTMGALMASHSLTEAVTEGVLEASKAGLSKDQILAVLARVVEIIEADEED